MLMPSTFRVLVVHNAYQQRGGEDAVVEAEVALLKAYGHEVLEYRRDNAEIAGMSKSRLLGETLWSARTVRELTARTRNFSPDLIHVHNTFPLISPAIYWATDRLSVPVVQTLHNFRLICLNALFLREGKVCEDCMGHVPWRGVARACYRGSRAASATMAGMLMLHRGLGTYGTKVARYIALNEFCRGKFIEGGLPAERVVVKPNFVDFDAPQPSPRDGLLFVGRLSAEKGVSTLAQSMALLPDTRLRVVGDGPEAHLLRSLCGVTRLGRLPGDEVRLEMSRASALVLPSICYENFPRTIAEAYACGLPVIASRLGVMAELVEDGRTGLLFAPGDAHDLARKIAWAEQHPEEMRTMGNNARHEYEAKYTPEINYRQLMSIYGQAIAEVRDHAT